MAKRPANSTAAVAKQIDQKFTARSVLVRYVPELQRFGANRPAPDVFRPNPGDDHLSVNHSGVEPLADIVSFYRQKFQPDGGPVAACEHKVHEYNAACKRTSVRVFFDHTNSDWQFDDRDGSRKPAYRMRPYTPKNSQPSMSHSGVEYVRAFQEKDEMHFARWMCKRRFRLHNG